ncbi:MAG: hypothetical protein IH888_04250 [Planctomycetes bacterium]|nr:hypothetical protein [Planctomycetota bacterium]
MGIARTSKEVWTCDASGCGRTMELEDGGIDAMVKDAIARKDQEWYEWVTVMVTSHRIPEGWGQPGAFRALPQSGEALTYCPDHRDVKDLIDKGAIRVFAP